MFPCVIVRDHFYGQILGGLYTPITMIYKNMPFSEGPQYFKRLQFKILSPCLYGYK